MTAFDSLLDPRGLEIEIYHARSLGDVATRATGGSG
jgi:hypothetical protein